MKNIPTLTLVVAAALIDVEGRVLLQQRRQGATHGGLWEFPGGKVMDGETPVSALLREIAEELDIILDVTKLEPVCFSNHFAEVEAEREPIVILLYKCRAWQGQPSCLAGDAIEWVPPTEILTRAMPPLDIPLAKALLRAI